MQMRNKTNTEEKEMTKKEYVNNVTVFRFSLLSFGGINEISMLKDSEVDKYYSKYIFSTLYM